MNKIPTFIKDHIYILLGVVCIFAVGMVYIVLAHSGRGVISGDYVIYVAAEQPESVEEAEYISRELPAVADIAPIIEDSLIVVHVAGAVYNPGVFELPYGSRINDAVAIAGGATEYADLSLINLAAFAFDAMHIIVPVYGETPAVSVPFAGVSTSAEAEVSDGLVNINTATAAELQTLPGVGPVLSQNIVSFREAHGGFSSVEELINVPQIGAGRLDTLRPLVTVG